MAHWTFKVLKIGADGNGAWRVSQLKFPIKAQAVHAMAAFVLAHAERGNLPVVCLEPYQDPNIVTPEMMEAGAAVLRESADRSFDILARMVFEAMINARES